jgi:hypothetical protein
MALEDEIDRLYGLPLEEFTRERDQAARAARKAGRREDADAIARLRKPPIAAWAINRLARDRRRDVDLLLDSGKRLLDAQRAVLEGKERRELDQARSSLDKAVARLVGAARVLLEGRASEATLGKIDETLRLAAITTDGREQLARGTLAETMQGTGWDLLESLAAELPARPAARKPAARAKPARQARRSRAELDAARAAVREAQGRRREAAAAVREAEREQAAARRAVDRADARLDEARRSLAKAEDDVAQAEQMLRERQ